jgi:EpsD family peptidyl-prolyl cis-trans isomerase
VEIAQKHFVALLGRKICAHRRGISSQAPTPGSDHCLRRRSKFWHYYSGDPADGKSSEFSAMNLSSVDPKRWFGYPVIALLVGVGIVFLARYDKALASSESIIAHVGNEDITLNELEDEFRSENIPVEHQQNPQVIRHVLSEIVLRKYLMQEAIAENLDREPSVLSNVLQSRERILSIAAIRHHIPQNVADRAIEEYVRANPSKFANRKNFKVDQILLPASDVSQTVIDTAAQFKTLEEIEQKLNEMSLPHTRSTGALSGVELPEDIAQRIETRKPEDIFLIRSNTTALFFKIVSEQSAPLEPKQSAELAELFIRRQLFEDEVRRATLAAQEQATFEGDYAAIMGKTKVTKEEGSAKIKSLLSFLAFWKAETSEILIALMVGSVFGYCVRALRSRRRRRTEARKRYSY